MKEERAREFDEARRPVSSAPAAARRPGTARRRTESVAAPQPNMTEAGIDRSN